MKVSEFNYQLPNDRIALRPASPQDAARLLVVRRARLEDKTVRDLPELLFPGDILVFNDTKVIPARLFGTIGKGRVEATLLKPLGGGKWSALCKPAKKFLPGTPVDFGAAKAGVVENRGGGEVVLSFDLKKINQLLEKKGKMPLPPYIATRREVDARDRRDYQTTFAKREGAVAAPTAGLHFTKRLFAGLKKRGIMTTFVTLHVGAGTFLPVKAEDTEDHTMHTEAGEISKAVANAINAAQKKGGRVVAVGTTPLRLLETAAGKDGTIHPWKGETGLFITPGYKFRAIDLLFTNFHLPKSTLFMLVAAFSGLARMKRAYEHAIDRGYRFYSYGDATLLYPTRPR